MWCALETRCVWAGPALSELVESDKVVSEASQTDRGDEGYRCMCLCVGEKTSKTCLFVWKTAIEAFNKSKVLHILHYPLTLQDAHLSSSAVRLQQVALSRLHTCAHQHQPHTHTLFHTEGCILYWSQHSSAAAESCELMYLTSHTAKGKWEELRQVVKREWKWEIEEGKQN